VTSDSSARIGPSAAIVAAICGAEILSLAGYSIIPALLPPLVREATAARIRGPSVPEFAGFVAGGKWIRTCMGLSLSSGVFRFIASSLFGAGKPFFIPSPTIRFPERAQWGSRDRNASKAWRLAA